MIIAISGYAGSGKDTVGSIIQYLTEYPNSENITNENHRSYNSYVMDVGMGHKPAWTIKKFADPLREVCATLLGMPLASLYTDEFKQRILPDIWNSNLGKQMTGREFLQKVGTDAIRNHVHPNAWVNALMVKYKFYYLSIHDRTELFPDWIITDLRFSNEMKAIKERNGVTVRVYREYYKTYDTVHGPVHDWSDTEDGMGIRFICPCNKYTKEQALVKFRMEQALEKHISEVALNDATFDYVIHNNGTIDDLILKVKEMLTHFKII